METQKISVVKENDSGQRCREKFESGAAGQEEPTAPSRLA